MIRSYFVSVLIPIFVVGIIILIDELSNAKKHNRRKK
jgi:hypothetical protein